MPVVPNLTISHLISSMATIVKKAIHNFPLSSISILIKIYCITFDHQRQSNKIKCKNNIMTALYDFLKCEIN